MRIGFDATAMPARRAGAGVYTYHLARALATALAEQERLHIFDRRGALADLAPLPHVSVQRVSVCGRLRRTLWEQTALPLALRHAGIDVFHSPHHSLPAVSLGWKTVVTVHDVTFRLLPRRYTPARRWYMSVMTLLAARRADAVIVPSASVASDFRRLCGGRQLLTVIAEAPQPSMRVVEDEHLLSGLKARLGLPERFVLSVGTLEPGKNREALLRAMALLKRKGLRHALVVAGQRGWGGAQPELVAAQLGIADIVRYTGYVPDADLPLLYNLADVFVFPSWREGFGLPPLEAMACGTPVIASDRPAMPEVLGDAALYTAPGSPEQLAEALERVLADRGLHEELRRRGLAQAARYSWGRAAQETLAVYRRVLQR